jgi:SAM-dependent methyltransferase
MDANVPSDLQYTETAAYVGRFAPQARARILDVGCGSGGLAQALGAAGYAVTAIDSSAEAVQQARGRGIAARQADFLEFAGGPFDVVLFSFALHHISPLSGAVDKARALLAPGGRLILEEFAIERVDAATAAWFFGTQDILAAAGFLGETEPSGVLADKEPLARWRERFAPGRHGHGGHAGHGGHGKAAGHPQHGHGGSNREGHGHFSEALHEGDAMRAGVAAAFRILHEERTPALARFWLHRFREDALGVARTLVPLERLLIAQGMIRSFGFRIVAEAK